ncbi:MAG: AraC family ligand binding domain-containing protein [Candidatus Diapherotrites archaeon]|nr:AraC family ligand binding domain-containing protein [Candidatus Diapherotrites archaeon]
MKEFKLEITKLDLFTPNEPFGRVAKAIEVFDNSTELDVKPFRLQVIELPPNKSFDPHVHVSEHIIYIIEGNGSVAIWGFDDSKKSIEVFKNSKTDYAVSKGDIFIIPKDCPHAFSSGTIGLKELIINVPGIALSHVQRIVWTD